MEREITFNEYGRKSDACFKRVEPTCPFVAVIPTVTLETIDGVKDLNNCLVHVTNINTTFYVDDKHRIIITWAGPVEKNGYDYENNPLRLRSQMVYDFENNRAIYYNANGSYRLITLTEGQNV